MKICVILAALVAASPAWAQTKPASVGHKADNCQPIGKTEDGRLVYSMKCDRMPAPTPVAVAPPPENPAPAVEEDKGGIFGLHAPSFIRPTTEPPPGVGPAAPPR